MRVRYEGDRLTSIHMIEDEGGRKSPHLCVWAGALRLRDTCEG